MRKTIIVSVEEFYKNHKLFYQIFSKDNNQAIRITGPDCFELNMFNNKILHDVKFVSNVRDTI